MTTSLIIACAIGWAVVIAAVPAFIRIRRTVRDLRCARDRTFSVGNGGGEVTVTAPMSDAEYEELKARWLAAYGNNQGAHPVTELRPTSEEQQP